MLSELVDVAGLIGAWGVLGSALLWWPHLPHAWRQALALTASLAGLAFLLVALNSEGLRETPTTAFVLNTPYVTTLASAAASTAFYVLTGVCLLVGALGLAAGNELVERLTRGLLAPALLLATAVAVLRFVLEAVAAPQAISLLFGVTWLAPAVGAFFFVRLKQAGRGWRDLLRQLALFALLSRLPVMAMYALASPLRWGSHYDVTPLVAVQQPLTGRWSAFEPGSPDQLLKLGLLPQLYFWAPLTLFNGLFGALVAALVLRGRQAGGAAPQTSLASQTPR